MDVTDWKQGARGDLIDFPPRESREADQERRVCIDRETRRGARRDDPVDTGWKRRGSRGDSSEPPSSENDVTKNQHDRRLTRNRLRRVKRRLFVAGDAIADSAGSIETAHGKSDVADISAADQEERKEMVDGRRLWIDNEIQGRGRQADESNDVLAEHHRRRDCDRHRRARQCESVADPTESTETVGDRCRRFDRERKRCAEECNPRNEIAQRKNDVADISAADLEDRKETVDERRRRVDREKKWCVRHAEGNSDIRFSRVRPSVGTDEIWA
jgi:hypothetical protein